MLTCFFTGRHRLSLLFHNYFHIARGQLHLLHAALYYVLVSILFFLYPVMDMTSIDIVYQHNQATYEESNSSEYSATVKSRIG